MSHKSLFSRALSLDPERLHFAAHSHHLWPDASFDGQVRAWVEANKFADRKWDLIFGEVVPEAQAHVARELNLPSADTVVFAPNTHDLLLRMAEHAREIVHVPEVLYHWRMHRQSTAADAGSKGYAHDAGKRAVQEHLGRLGIDATVHDGAVPGM